MNKRNRFIAQVGFYLLVGGLLFYAASRTLDFVSSTVPAGKTAWGYLFLLSTGGGAVIWLMVFLNWAEGSKQRGIASVMGILDLVGELIMVYADSVKVAADNALLKMTESDLQTFVIASVAILGVNIIAGYAFHLFDPRAEQESKARDLVDEVTDAAMNDLNSPGSRQEMVADLAPMLKQAVRENVAEKIRLAAGEIKKDIAIPAPDVFVRKEATVEKPELGDSFPGEG